MQLCICLSFWPTKILLLAAVHLQIQESPPAFCPGLGAGSSCSWLTLRTWHTQFNRMRTCLQTLVCKCRRFQKQLLMYTATPPPASEMFYPSCCYFQSLTNSRQKDSQAFAQNHLFSLSPLHSLLFAYAGTFPWGDFLTDKNISEWLFRHSTCSPLHKGLSGNGRSCADLTQYDQTGEQTQHHVPVLQQTVGQQAEPWNSSHQQLIDSHSSKLTGCTVLLGLSNSDKFPGTNLFAQN